MSWRRHIVEALAGAFLEGAWDRESMKARAAELLGERPSWLDPAVKRVLETFPRAPRDSRSALVRLLSAQDISTWSRRKRARFEVRDFPLDRSAMVRPRFDVPVMDSVGALGDWLMLSPDELSWFADPKGFERFNATRALLHYDYAFIRKRSGGLRIIETPKRRLKQLQRKVLHGILDRVPPHEAAHGFRAGRSIRTHAALHTGRAFVLRLDLEDFFPSIPRGRVFGLFHSLGYPEQVARLLASLCTNRGPRSLWKRAPPPLSEKDRRARWELARRFEAPHLPQGAPTSPALANLCALGLDLRLSALAARSGARYSRYADDLCFSGDETFARGAERFASRAASIAIDEGFAVNHHKTRFMRRGGRQTVTGVVVNAGMNVPREEYERLEATLFNCVRSGPESQNRADVPEFRRHLEGRIAFVASLHAARGARLKALFSRIAWPSD